MTPKAELSFGAEKAGAVVGSSGCRRSSEAKMATPFGSWEVIMRRTGVE